MRPAISFDEHYMVVHHYVGPADYADLGFASADDPTFKDMLANMFHGGNIAFLGIPSEQFAIDWKTVIFNMITIKGIYGRQMFETWYKMAAILQSGLNIRPVITHRVPFTEYQHAFNIMGAGQSGKVVMDWHT